MGGPGPDQFDMLDALDAWVDRGEAPDQIIATHLSESLTRPLCPYPQIATYDGRGDPNDAASFSCL